MHTNNTVISEKILIGLKQKVNNSLMACHRAVKDPMQTRQVWRHVMPASDHGLFCSVIFT